jgi:glycosyltransferase involved in cell wall biosynthesis
MRVLILGHVWPEPRSSAAGLRAMNLVRAFRRAGWDVVFASAARDDDGHAAALAGEGVRVAAVRANDARFDAFVKELDPDFCVFDRFLTEERFGWRVAMASPRTARVLDTVDLHFLRRARMSAVAAGTAEAGFEGGDAAREIAAIYRSDLSFVLSDFEQRLLAERFEVPPGLVRLLRFGYPPPAGPGPAFGERRGFAVIGNFRHPPNRDGVLWLRRELWPRIRRRLPVAEVELYGAYPPKDLMALDDPAGGFRMRGRAEDQFAALARARVNLAPLRFGAGIKGKISDGWWSGTPAVTTPVGAEGMSGGLPWGGAIESDPDAFAEAAVALHEEPARWEEARLRGRRILAGLYDEETNARALLSELHALRDRLEESRARNFVGAMLRHHAHRSTVYFSRWIELKESLTALRD